MNKSIVFAGNIIVDSVKTLTTWPEVGMLATITDMKRSVGGSVSNTAIDLKTLDPSVRVSALGKVGADDNGDYALRFIASKGVDCGGVTRVEGVPTTFTDVMSVAKTGERTFFNMHGADSRFTPDDVDVASLDCDIFHLGYLLLMDGLDAADDEYGTKAARLLAKVQAAGIKTSVDIVSEQSDRFARIVRPALKYCDYLVVNEIEGALATGIPCKGADGKVTVDALGRIAEALFALGVKEKVVLHCPETSLCREADGTVTVVNSLSLPADWIKGSVGAGDAFCAGMLYSFLTGLPAEQGLRLATCAAAANLAAPDSVSGALPLAETLALDGRFPRRSV